MTLAAAEAELAAALEHTLACRDRYDSAIAPAAVARYEVALDAAYAGESAARDRLAACRTVPS